MCLGEDLLDGSVGVGNHANVDREQRATGRQFPDVQVVYVADAFDGGQLSLQVIYRYVIGCSLQEKYDTVLEHGASRNEDDNGEK